MSIVNPHIKWVWITACSKSILFVGTLDCLLVPPGLLIGPMWKSPTWVVDWDLGFSLLLTWATIKT